MKKNSENFHCAEWDRVGYYCERQCDACAKIDNDGGVSHAYAIPTIDIASVTVASGVITGFTLESGKSFSKLAFDFSDPKTESDE